MPADEHRPVLRNALAGGGEQRPAAGEGEQAGLPPALAQAHVEPGRPADQAVQQHAPGLRVVGRAEGADAEVAGGDDERRDAPRRRAATRPRPAAMLAR